MNNTLVQLSFALSASEDPLSAAMAHSHEYEQLYLFADQNNCITIQCNLPEDAHAGDVLSLNATKPLSRGASYASACTLCQADIERHYVLLTINNVLETDDFVLQLMLHGLHKTLKDSAQFDVHIANNEYAALSADLTADKPLSLSGKLRHYLANFGTTLLTLF